MSIAVAFFFHPTETKCDGELAPPSSATWAGVSPVGSRDYMGAEPVDGASKPIDDASKPSSHLNVAHASQACQPQQEAEPETDYPRLSPELSPELTGEVSGSLLQASGPHTYLPGTEPVEFSAQFAAVAAEKKGYIFVDCVDTYLSYRDKAPSGYEHLKNSGRKLLQGQPIGAATEAYKEAAIIAYDGYRFDGVFEMWRRTNSPYYGRGVEVVKYLRSRGRDWFTAVVIMEFESTCATDPRARNDFGICDSTIDMSWDLKGYCDYLDKWQMRTFNGLSNDLQKIMMVYNDYSDYRNNFYRAAGSLMNWWP